MQRQRFYDAHDFKRMPVLGLGDVARSSDQRIQEGGV